MIEVILEEPVALIRHRAADSQVIRICRQGLTPGLGENGLDGNFRVRDHASTLVESPRTMSRENTGFHKCELPVTRPGIQPQTHLPLAEFAMKGCAAGTSSGRPVARRTVLRRS